MSDYKTWITEMERRCWIALESGYWVHNFDIDILGRPLFISDNEASQYMVAMTYPESSEKRKIAKLVSDKSHWESYPDCGCPSGEACLCYAR